MLQGNEIPIYETTPNFPRRLVIPLKSSWPKRNDNFRTAFGTGLSAEEFHDIFFALGGPCQAQKRRASAEAVKEQGSEQQLLDSCT